MAMMTPVGMARLFPGDGQHLATNLADLGAMIGDRDAGRLLDVASHDDRRTIVRELDRWFGGRLTAAQPDVERFAAAYAMLSRDGKIGAAAVHAGLSIRQLQRLSMAYVGISPKQIYEIQRLRASLVAVQLGRGDPLAGFADQSHQIRTWKKRLDLTPAAYARRGQSLIRRSIAVPEQWTHYL
jgi:AraC-like DNA-binding protein